MTKVDLERFIGHLDRLQPDSDEHLLSRFIAARDEASFASLVRRHGPIVFGLCRRLLKHQQDAEDCFQATFIILARRASVVVKRASLAGWLYAVAYRTAQRIRCVNARRYSREKQVNEMPHPATVTPEPQDWRPVLDEELNRLSELYRTAVLLCEIEGRPRKEVAQQLGIPEGTLSSRLAKAKKLLARRLASRGVTLTGGTLTTVLAGAETLAAVPAVLVNTTSKAAVLAAAGQLAANATTASALTHEVMKAMFLTKLKAVVAGVVLVVTLGAAGIATSLSGGQAAQAQAPAAKPASGEVEALRREIELLRLNLRVTLEKLDALEKRQFDKGVQEQLQKKEAEYEHERALRLKKEQLFEAEKEHFRLRELENDAKRKSYEDLKNKFNKTPAKQDVVGEIEAIIQALRGAKAQAEQEKLLKALEQAIRKMKNPAAGPQGKYQEVPLRTN